MICLDNTDLIQGDADNPNEVDYTIHGLIAGTFTQLAAGQLPNAKGTLYPATAAVSVVSIILVNTGAAAQAVNLYLDPDAGGNSRRLIPQDVSLGIGYSLHFDGQRISVMNPTGAIVYTHLAHTHDGDTLQIDGINSNGGAFAFTTSGLVTFSQNIAFAGQLAFPAVQNPSADPNTLDDHKKGEAQIAFTASTSGTVTANPSFDTIAYTKTGREVHISGRLGITAVNAPVGGLIITGLPFACANLTDRAGDSVITVAYEDIDTLDAILVGTIVEGASQITVQAYSSTGVINSANIMKAGTRLTIGGSYIAA